MANVVSGVNPWKIDTASATAITADRVRVAKIRWIAGTESAAGNRCVVTDSAGHLFWEDTADGANHDSESDTFQGQAGDVNGLVVSTLGAGHLLVYHA